MESLSPSTPALIHNLNLARALHSPSLSRSSIGRGEKGRERGDGALSLSPRSPSLSHLLSLTPLPSSHFSLPPLAALRSGAAALSIRPCLSLPIPSPPVPPVPSHHCPPIHRSQFERDCPATGLLLLGRGLVASRVIITRPPFSCLSSFRN